MNFKKIGRRKFVIDGLKTSLTIPFLLPPMLSCKSPESNSGVENSSKKLNILILGGTSFLGPHQIAYALKRGHSITTFTRGKTEPTVHKALFDKVEMLIGDRENDLTALEGRDWDVVIDNSGRKVEWTQRSSELLKDHVQSYVYISSTGVYYPYLTDNIREDQTLLMEEPEELEDEDMKMEYWFGVMKANSEAAAKSVFGDRTMIIRPTYMIGPGDRMDRFIYWPVRLAQGGEIMVPGHAKDPVQYIDVRDVAKFIIDAIEKSLHGAYNVVGPSGFQNSLDFAKKASKAFELETEFISIDDHDFLEENEFYYLIPWILPRGNNYGTARINNEKAQSAGLTYRAVSDTVKDIHDWWYSDAVDEERRTKFFEGQNSIIKKEREILKKWKTISKR